MSNQTIKKAPFNRGDEELMSQLRSIWLGIRVSNFLKHMPEDR